MDLAEERKKAKIINMQGDINVFPLLKFQKHNDWFKAKAIMYCGVYNICESKMYSNNQRMGKG